MRLDAKSIRGEIDKLAGKKPAPPAQRKPRPPPSPPKLEIPEVTAKTEPTEPAVYADYALLMTPFDGFQYNHFQFNAPNKDAVDLPGFAHPIKLNRKNPRPPPLPSTSSVASSSRQPENDIKPMLGNDGKEVLGVDGKPVMLTMVDGKEVTLAKHQQQKERALKGKEAVAEGKKKIPNKPKTRQVFVVPPETLKLRREEKFPWVLEDATDDQRWVGRMNDRNADNIFAFFVVNATGEFNFIPCNRSYDFMPAKRYVGNVTIEQAEADFAEHQNKNTLAALFKRRGHQPSAATLATIRKTEQAEELALPTKRGKVKVKKSADSDDDDEGGVKEEPGDDLFGDDDDDRGKKEELGAEGTYEELDFDEDMADDEDAMEADDAEDEETKELQERIKKEFRGGLGSDNEDDFDEPTERLTGEGSHLKKALRQYEQADIYDSDDDEENPYASEEESDDDDTKPPELLLIGVDHSSNVKNKGGQAQPQPQRAPTPTAAVAHVPAPTVTVSHPSSKQKPKSKNNSRANSANPPSRGATPGPSDRRPARGSTPAPDLPLPVGAGAALLARRATSPYPAKPKGRAPKGRTVSGGAANGKGGRATSPLANQYIPDELNPEVQMSSSVSPAPPTESKKRKHQDGQSGPALSTQLANGSAPNPPSPHPNKKRKAANDAPLPKSGVMSAPVAAPVTANGTAAAAPIHNQSKKRKAGDEGAGAAVNGNGAVAGTAAEGAKKKAKVAPTPNPNISLPEAEALLIEYLRVHPGLSTKDLSSYVKKTMPVWTKNHDALTVFLKKVANHTKNDSGGVSFTLKAGY